MSQSKKGSAIETASSTAFGFIVAMIVQPIILGAFGMSINFHQDVALTVIFTLISVVRSYVFRRVFNRLHMKGIIA